MAIAHMMGAFYNGGGNPTPTMVELTAPETHANGSATMAELTAVQQI